jgi:hypothetical protein
VALARLVRCLLRKLRDLPADFADTCLICLADELNRGGILTLDWDFELYRWRRTPPFDIFFHRSEVREPKFDHLRGGGNGDDPGRVRGETQFG